MDQKQEITVRRGDVVYVDLSPVTGSEQGGPRPAVVIQNNTGNIFSPTIIIACTTASVSKKKLPTHVELIFERYRFLERNSTVLAEQLRTIDKTRVKEVLGSLTDEDMQAVDNALYTSLGLRFPRKQ